MAIRKDSLTGPRHVRMLKLGANPADYRINWLFLASLPTTGRYAKSR